MLSISSRPQCVYIPGLEKVYLKHSISSAVKAPVLAPIVRPQNMLSRTLRSPLQKNHSGSHGTAKKNMYLKNRNRIILCHAESIFGNIKQYIYILLYSNFLSFVETVIVQAVVIEILLNGRQGPVCLAWSIPWLLMAWRCKEPGISTNGTRASAAMVFRTIVLLIL